MLRRSGSSICAASRMGSDGVRDLKSANTGLPGSPPLRSLRSSAIWKATPRCRPKVSNRRATSVLPGEPAGGRAAEAEQRAGLPLHDAPEPVHREREVAARLHLADGRAGHLGDGRAPRRR